MPTCLRSMSTPPSNVAGFDVRADPRPHLRDPVVQRLRLGGKRTDVAVHLRQPRVDEREAAVDLVQAVDELRRLRPGLRETGVELVCAGGERGGAGRGRRR